MIDLHIHSTASDGTFSPAAIAAEARRAGLTAAALTDHDTLDGIPEFLTACNKHGIDGIPGLELSASWYGGSLHVVGLFVDQNNTRLNQLLTTIREHRDLRNREMLHRLAEANMVIHPDELLAEADGGVPGRPHFASIMLRKGYCADFREVFDRWLGTGCSAYIRRFLPLPEEAIACIHAAGGVAIMAHPFGNPNGEAVSKVRKMLKSLVDVGIDGIEVYYSDHSPEETATALHLANEFNLLVSGGSDFHGERTPGIKLGTGKGDLHVPDDLLPALERVIPIRVQDDYNSGE